MLKRLALVALTSSTSSSNNEVEGASVAPPPSAALRAALASSTEATSAFATGLALGAARRAPAPLIASEHLKARPSSTGSYVPVALVHGLGDSHDAPGMLSLVASVTAAYEGAYAISAAVPDSIMSYLVPIQEQIDTLAAVLKADPVISAAGKVVLAGLSQGGMIVRGYTQQYSGVEGYPQVVNLVSVCGVINGEFGCPGQVSWIPGLCTAYEENPYDFLLDAIGVNITLSFQDYTVAWRNQTMYMTENPFLPVLNNEVPHPDAPAYKARITALNKYLMIGATEDTVIIPWWAEQMGGWEFNNPDQVPYYFNQSAQYTKDLTGLRTLADSGRLAFDHFKGDHLQFDTAYWDGHILPSLGVEA